MEKYTTFNVGQVQFIDSLQYMNSYLEKLVANMHTENLNITSKGLTDKELALLQRKGVFTFMSIWRAMSASMSYSYLRRDSQN